MSQRFASLRNNNKNNISSKILTKSNNIQNHSIDYSSRNNSYAIKYNICTPFKKNALNNLFLNRNQKNLKKCLFKNINTTDNYSINKNEFKFNKIKLFDRPIYNSPFPENTKNNSMNEQSIKNLYPSKENNNKNPKEKKMNGFNNLFFFIKNRKRANYLLLDNNKKIRHNLEYFPKLLDFKRLAMINKKTDKYKDKNILFIKMKDLNFEKELRNTTKNNFITPDRYLTINNNEEAKFLEKKTTYKILENITFRFKSPNDKSKLQKYTKDFNSFLAVNKFID